MIADRYRTEHREFVVAADVGDGDVKHLRAVSDRVKAAIGSGAVILGGIREGKAYLVVSATKDVSGRVDADGVVKQVQSIIDGRGGGNR